MVYIIRHGITEWNEEGRLQGGMDSALASAGEQGSKMVGNILLGENPHGKNIYTSPSGRAVDTTEIIAGVYGEKQMNIIEHELLKEMSFGRHEGMTKAERRVGQKLIEMNARNSDPYNVALPGGENYSQLRKRAQTVLDTTELLDEDTIVSHEGFNRMLLGLVGGLTDEEALSVSQPNDVMYKYEGGALFHRNLEDNAIWIPGILTKD